jgi:peptide subunit release factor 1 (eRF1)
VFNRQSIIDALKSLYESITKYKKIPKNGIAFFYGWYIDETGKEIRGKFELEPPKPIRISKYLCDKRFHVEYIEDLYVSYNKYGVLLLLGQEYQIWTLEGTTLSKIVSVSKSLPNHHCRGGYSQNRLERLRQEAVDVYMKSINEKLEKVFLDSEYQSTIRGLIIVGNGEKKIQIKGYLNQKFEESLLGILTGLQVELDKCLELINKDLVEKNKKEWTRVEYYIRTNPDYLSYGLELETDLLNCFIKKLFVNQSNDQYAKHVDVDKIIIPRYDPIYQLLEGYGGCIGIKWNETHEFENMNHQES